MVTISFDTEIMILIVAIVALIISIAVPIIGFILKRVETRGENRGETNRLVEDVRELQRTVNDLREKVAGLSFIYNSLNSRLLARDENRSMAEENKK